MEKEKVIAQLMNTVGYNESDDKAEFLKGAGMAFDKCDVEYALLKSGTSTTIFQRDKELDEVKDFAQSLQKFLNCYGAL